ncbi:MAG TPA: M15 family metallopeptidase [Spirochaetota bacterium]|nr:M15 family metallopeptidase [Spirochaetota bacterium]
MKKLIFVLMIPFFAFAYELKDLAGGINPSSDSSFINLKKTFIRTDSKTHYLRKEAAYALEKMSAAFDSYIKELNSERAKNNQKEVSIKITVISSTRTFDDQARIWNSKWNGAYSKEKNLYKRGINILDFSSMPGTSRHHWGTDFDINSLNNSFFENGDGQILYTWLVVNAARFGFAQPYTSGRTGGYQEEKWHWSYLPLSKKFLNEWNNKYSSKKDFYILKKFSGSELFIDKAEEYVNTISPVCL